MPKVLIVDDDPGIAEIACTLLRAEGHQAQHLTSAADALAHLRLHKADLAILDFDIAKREGLDLAEAICEQPILDGCALIGVAFDLKDVDLELVDLAVQKPYATGELGKVVASVLRGA